MEKKGQQEIAGFVIIVVLVIVAVFIFVIMYFANKKENLENKEVEVLLISMTKVTTDCFLDEGRPSSLNDVLKDAYDSIPKKCKNNGKTSREYIDEFLPKTMDDILSLETNFESYVFEVVDEGSGTIIKTFSKGQCSGKEIKGASFLLKEGLGIYLRIC